MLEKRLEVSAEGKKVYDIVIENSFSNLVKELSAHLRFRNESYVLLQNEGWLPIIWKKLKVF